MPVRQSAQNMEDSGRNGAGDFEMEDPSGGKPPYMLPARISRMLYPYQLQGLKWLWFLHCRGTGGILGDDMGLGKTIQVGLLLTHSPFPFIPISISSLSCSRFGSLIAFLQNNLIDYNFTSFVVSQDCNH